ncbi:MAG: MotA/TolQ/ExbB proton channel family protein [Psychromonas sp.]|nr:MotA/TolQ/ExbB proton channel family protein [Psychromonas sp.]
MAINVVVNTPIEISVLTQLTQTMPTWFLQGGAVMWVLLFFSFLTTIITLERLLTWISYFPKKEEYALQDCFAALNNHQQSEALIFTKLLNTPALVMLKQGILALPFSPQSKMKAYAAKEVSLMSKGQSLLRLVFHSAPIIGLLGCTIIASNQLSTPGILIMDALSLALIPLSTGLLVTILAQLPYYLFQVFLKQLRLHLTHVQSEFLYICQQKELVTNKISSIMQAQEESLNSQNNKPNAQTDTVAQHSEMPYHYDFKDGTDEVKVTIHREEMLDIKKPSQASLIEMYEESACENEYYGVDEVELQEQQEHQVQQEQQKNRKIKITNRVSEHNK